MITNLSVCLVDFIDISNQCFFYTTTCARKVHSCLTLLLCRIFLPFFNYNLRKIDVLALSVNFRFSLVNIRCLKSNRFHKFLLLGIIRLTADKSTSSMVSYSIFYIFDYSESGHAKVPFRIA